MTPDITGSRSPHDTTINSLAISTLSPFDFDATTNTVVTDASPTQAKKRKVLGMKAERDPLLRSISTPLIASGGPVMAESEADKKRNKLGYQRISIACSHCRRRKIRCLIAEGDARNRCQNCIRLKKDCVFFPVDQQSGVENTSQGSAKAAGSTVSSSPPSSEKGGNPTVPTPVTGSFSGLTLDASTLAVQEDDYGPRSQQMSPGPWTQDSVYSAPSSAVMPTPLSPSSHYWRYTPAGIASDSAPYPSDGQAHTLPSQSFDYQARNAHAWQNPPHTLRSMSYGETLPSQDMPYHSSYPTTQAPLVPGRYHPMSLDVHTVPSQSGGPRSAPIIGPQMGYPHSGPYAVQQEYSPYSAQPEYQQGWYGPGTYGGMEEEQHGPYSGRPS